MDIDVAGLTRRRYQARIRKRPAGEVAAREELRGMPHLRVALLAQHGAGSRKQALEIGAMRVVAVEAIFPDRRVLEQKGPTLLGMTAVADVVDAIGFEQGVRRRTMGIVAVDAGYLSLRQRHVRAHVKLRALDLVAGKAGLVDGLARRQTMRGEIRHRVVAIAAGEFVVFVNRAVPENPGSALVA